jgi:hypothetical protein
MAQLVGEQGLFDIAIAEMTAVSDELLEAGMPLEAACAALDMVALFVLAGRQERLEPLLRELMTKFAAAGLQREATTTLSFLRDTARARTVGLEAVEQSWGAIRRLAVQRSSDGRSSS